MSYKKALVNLLDRPGGRFALGMLATSAIRRSSKEDLEIKYVNGLWTRRIGPHFLPDSWTFDYRYEDFSVWKQQMDRYISDATDYWLQYYRPKEGDVIVDVGAGRGEDTFAFSRGVGKTGRVIAVEAHPVSYTILKSFCKLNGLTNVTPLHLALMDKSGIVRIVESSSSWMEHAVEDGNGSGGTQVRAATLGEVCDQHGVEEIAFLKMNIEGAERYALAGMDSLMPRIRQICVACHDFLGQMGRGEQFRTRAFVENFLTGHGFALRSRPEDDRDYVRDHVFGLRCTER